MLTNAFRLTIFAFAFVSSVSAQVPATGRESLDAAKSISASSLRGHIRFLSGPLLGGRETGTRGYDIAAEYIASQMDSIGLRPAGDNGDWFQKITFTKSTGEPRASTLLLLAGDRKSTLIEGTDYIVPPNLVYKTIDFEAPVVFVGYGVTAPELGYDDYAGVDVRGKIVLHLFGAPPRFPSSQRAHYSNYVTKSEIAATHGAIARIRITAPEDEKIAPWKAFVRIMRGGILGWLKEDSPPSYSFPELKASVALSASGTRALFAQSPKSAEMVFQNARESRPQSFALPLRARIRARNNHNSITSANIIGVIPGSDPALREQYVVYTAHLDHLGICPPVGGDNVCHGAWDNASGVASLLEVARAYTKVHPPPRRSVLFVVSTAEESGLLGADYFAHFPTIPRESIIANINIDSAPGLLGATNTLTAFGSEHSTLGSNAEKAASQLGYEITPDPMPEQIVFVRSDQYSFVRQGIPALFLTDGKAGMATLMQFIGTKYHTPLDRIDHPFDYQAAARAAGVTFLIGHDVAQQDDRPTWKPGDFFGETFGRHRSAASSK
jgi:hypothetical protein